MTQNNSTEVKILGERAIKIYDVWSYGGDIYEKKKVIENPIIWEGLLENPPFEKGESIYIETIEKEVEIQKVIRSTSNKYVYYVDYVEELIENEDTKKSYEDAVIKSEEIKEKRKKEADEKLNKTEELVNSIDEEQFEYDDIEIADVGVQLNKAIKSLKDMQRNRSSESETIGLCLDIQIILHQTKADILKAHQATLNKINC